MIPWLFRYYWKPIELEDIPALREDDSAATTLGAFRADQAARDAKYAQKHDGKRKRNLGWDLLLFFKWSILYQFVSCNAHDPIDANLTSFGRRFSSASNTYRLPDFVCCSDT